MGTNNFHNVNASKYFSALLDIENELDSEFAYDDLVESLYAEIENKFKWVRTDVRRDPHELRSYPSKTLGIISQCSYIGDTFFMELEVIPVIRNGYYAGVNLDWIIQLNFNYNDCITGHNWKEQLTQVISWNYKDKNTRNAMTDKAIKWAEKNLDAIVKDLEEIYTLLTQPMEKVAQFSNGEAVYHRV